MKNKSFGAWIYMWENFPEKHWYMKADDDTYIIVPNLLTALHNYDHTKPYGISVDRSSSVLNLIWFILFIGRKIAEGSLLSGGAGYLMSHAALKMVSFLLSHFINIWYLIVDICTHFLLNAVMKHLKSQEKIQSWLGVWKRQMYLLLFA